MKERIKRLITMLEKEIETAQWLLDDEKWAPSDDEYHKQSREAKRIVIKENKAVIKKLKEIL